MCNRNLPAKSPIEEKKHRQQYETMVAQARKKGESQLVLVVLELSMNAAKLNKCDSFIRFSVSRSKVVLAPIKHDLQVY